jgi:hypothetical protein
MLPIHLGRPGLATILIIIFASLMTLGLYSWLLTPLEDAH